MVASGGGAAQRSTATVLFTDLVASTAMRARLGEDAAEELRREHDRLVFEVIEAHRGKVVKHLGDGVMATFVGAADAVRAAVAVQQGLERRNRGAAGGVALAVRIGISAGDVTVEDDDCFGTPVIEAARLCAAAGDGVVLVSEVVRLLGGAATREQLLPVGALELKGLPDPLPAYEVSWKPAAPPPLPMPGLLTGAGRIFVGREEESQRLLRLWKEVEAGERRVALLGGEPGIGKTRLAVWLAVEVHEAGGVVLAGRCDEDLGVPYQPFVEALRHYVTVAADPRLGRHPGELTRLVPELDQLVGELPAPLRADAETERYRLFEALTVWLSALSVETPVLLVLDDLHWAAKPTLLLLRHILRSNEPLRLLVVVTYRDSDICRGHPMTDFLAELRREAGVERLSISGLDTVAVTAFIESAAGHRLSEGEAQELPGVVWRETAGNPFFVAEVLRHLSETGAVEQQSGRWVLSAALEDLGVPEGVRDVVGRRLSRLSETTNRVLAAAAVLGLEFEPAVAERVAAVGEEEFLAALEEAAAARLLVEVPGGRFRFGHALVRATLYDELSGPRRVALHRRAAEAVESIHAAAMDDQLPALAHHWARASAPMADAARAVDYATRAGDRAAAQLAHDEAAGYYAAALELLDHADGGTDPAPHIELLIRLGEAQHRVGDRAHRETLLRAGALAVQQGDAAAAARAALANNRGFFSSGIGQLDSERIAAFEAALDLVGPAESVTRARLLAALSVELMFGEQRERQLRLADEALVCARHVGDLATLADVLSRRSYAIASPSTLAERMAISEELLDLAARLNDPLTQVRALVFRVRPLGESGRFQEAFAILRQAEAIADELGHAEPRWMVQLQVTTLTILTGDLDAAEVLARGVYELASSMGQVDAESFLAAHLFSIRFEQGRLTELEQPLRERIATVPGLSFFRPWLGVLLCELDRREEAREQYEWVAADGFARLRYDSLELIATCQCAALCAQLGVADGARELYDRLSPYADQVAFVLGGSLGAVSHYLGLLAATLEDWDSAERWFAEAAASHERAGLRIWLAHTRLEWAAMLLTRDAPGDAERARRLLDQAIATARPGGWTAIVRRAEALLTGVAAAGGLP